jgi:hypothetical protein
MYFLHHFVKELSWEIIYFSRRMARTIKMDIVDHITIINIMI